MHHTHGSSKYQNELGKISPFVLTAAAARRASQGPANTSEPVFQSFLVKRVSEAWQLMHVSTLDGMSHPLDSFEGFE